MAQKSITNVVISYFRHIGDAISQLINVVFFISENPNESVSGRAWRQRSHWFWGAMRVVLDCAAFVFEKNHCKKSHMNDVARARITIASEDA